MYKLKSYEFNFFFLINKCILLFKYIDNEYQKEILNEIKLFINKLQEIFSKSDFNNSNDKKNKILELLIHYFETLINVKIYKLINHENKDLIINEINKISLLACENNEKKNIDIVNNTRNLSEYNDTRNLSEYNDTRNLSEYNDTKNLSEYSTDKSLFSGVLTKENTINKDLQKEYLDKENLLKKKLEQEYLNKEYLLKKQL
jgi:hypothetical protein